MEDRKRVRKEVGGDIIDLFEDCDNLDIIIENLIKFRDEIKENYIDYEIDVNNPWEGNSLIQIYGIRLENDEEYQKRIFYNKRIEENEKEREIKKYLEIKQKYNL